MKVKGVMLFCLLFSLVFAESAFEVIHQDDAQVTFKMRLPEYEIEQLKLNHTEYHTIIGRFDGVLAEPGKPVIPYLSTNIGVPENGSITYSIVNTEKITRKNINIEPAQEMALDGKSSTGFIKSQFVYSSSIKYPLRNAEIGEKIFIGNRSFIPLKVFPFQYSASTKTLDIITEITIQVQIQGNKEKKRSIAGLRNYIDSVGDDFFINNEVSKYWRKDKELIPDGERTRSGVANQIQFIVDEEGIYKVDYDYLVDSLQVIQDSLEISIGLNFSLLDPRYLELYDENGPVPILIEGEEDGSFDEGDYIEFYGDRHYGDESYFDEYTSENVYTLKLLDSIGSRFAYDNGGIVEEDLYGYNRPDSYEYTKHFEQQNSIHKLGLFDVNSYYEIQDNYREDIYFWKSAIAPSLNATPFEIEYPSDGGQERFSASAMLVGETHPGRSGNWSLADHHAIVSINGSLIGNKTWVGQKEAFFESTNEHPNEFLSHGSNDFFLSLLGDASNSNEKVLLDYFELKYWREYKTDLDELKFSKPGNTPLDLYQFDLHNFSSDDVTIYKLGSAIVENFQVQPFTENGGAPYTISFQDSIYANNIEYYIVTEENKKTPKAIRADIGSNLKHSSNRADYILLTTSEFTDSEGIIRLKQLWSQRGKQVKIIDVQDIYDEFNNGIRSADAIKDFLTYAYNNWQAPELSHVLIFGDGCYDNGDDSSDRKYNIVPFRTVWTWKLGATASDIWYGCVVGSDFAPEIAVARVNIWEEEQINDYVDKVEFYLNNPNYEDLWHANVTLAAGGKTSDANDIFARQSENLRRYFIPQEYNVQRVYTSTQTVSAEYNGNTTTLKNYINDGSLYVQFMGHGGGRLWADYNLFNYTDVTTLTNVDLSDNGGAFPIFGSLSCYGSSFETPGGACIGEAVILTPGRGGIGHLGFAGLGYLNEDEDWGECFFEGMFEKKFPTIGEVFNFALAKYYATSSNNSKVALTAAANYLGDPMIGLFYPENDLEIEIDNYNVAVGDTVRITVKPPTDIVIAHFYVGNENETLVNAPYNQIPQVVNQDGEIKYDFLVTNGLVDGVEDFVVRVYGYGNEREAFGMSKFTVGKAAAVDIKYSPENPTLGDEVTISGKFFHEDGIQSVVCYKFTGSSSEDEAHLMVWDEESNSYVVETPFASGEKIGHFIRFYFQVTTGLNNTELIYDFQDTDGNDVMYSYVISGHELDLTNMVLTEYEGEPKIKVLLKNIGDFALSDFPMNLYTVTESSSAVSSKEIREEVETLVSEIVIENLDSLESRWIYMPVTDIVGETFFRLYANKENADIENDKDNNEIEGVFTLNLINAGATMQSGTSLDGNFTVEFPENLLSEDVYFSISEKDSLTAINQDLHYVELDNEMDFLRAYEVRSLNYDVFLDTLGTLPNNGVISLIFNYSKSDTITQNNEKEENFFIYRWESFYQKWIYQGGFINFNDDQVTLDVNRLGTYALFYKNDYQKPAIEINVEDQDFVMNGLVASDGVLSFIISDDQGIDIIDNKIQIFIGENEINNNDYSVTAGLGGLVNIPVKYQLDLPEGNYSASIYATDVNGNYADKSITFQVNKGLDLKNLANYPNPVKSKTSRPDYSGRTRFTYKLTDNADDVYMKIFTVSGRLVKTFKNMPKTVGYHEYPRDLYAWDCRDEKGRYLANGVYFYKVVAKKDGKKVEKIQKMAILK